MSVLIGAVVLALVIRFKGQRPGDGVPRTGHPPVSPAAAPEPESAPELRRRLLLAVVLGLAVYAGMALWADLGGLGAALSAIPWWAPLAACGLSLSNYLVRFPRWQRYLRLTGSEVTGWTSLRIYLAGLSLTVSPGKVGEAMKSWLLRSEDGTPIARSAPIVLAERLTDLLGFLVLIALTSTAADHAWIAAAALGLTAAVLVLVTSRGAGRALCAVTGRLPLVGSLAGRLEESLEASRRLLAPRELVATPSRAPAGSSSAWRAGCSPGRCSPAPTWPTGSPSPR